MKKLLSLAVLFPLLAVGQNQVNLGVGIYSPGSGNPVAAGSITNLSPHAASLYATAQSRIITNFTTVFTNYSASSATNIIADVTGSTATNGWLRVTNGGFYNVGFAINYRFNVLTASDRTNVFGVTTNVGSPGTNFTDLFVTTSGRGGTNFFNAASSGIIYCPSNTYIAFGYYSVGTQVTNDLTIGKLALTAFLPGGSTLGGNISGGGGAGISTNASQFAANTTLTIASGAATTNQSILNMTNRGVQEVVGAQTNRSTLGVAGAGFFASTLGVDGAFTHNGTMRGNGAYTNTSGGITAEGAGFASRDGADYVTLSALSGGLDTGFSAFSITPHITTPGSINLAGLTVSRALVLDANGMVTNATSADPSNEYVKADGTTGVPAGGPGGTAEGNSGDIQFNQGDTFAGTNYLTFDRTNNRVAIALAGVRPNEAIEIGGATPKVRLGGSGTGETNVMDSRGIGTISGGAFEVRAGVGSVVAYFDGTGGDLGIYPNGDNSKILGSPVAAWSTNYVYQIKGYGTIAMPYHNGDVYSNSTINLHGSGSTVTIYSTNQNWKMQQTSNVTFAVDGLVSNVVYSIDWTNNASTITWSGIDFWRDGATPTFAPSLLAGRYDVKLRKGDHGVEAWVDVGPAPIFNLISGVGGANTNFTLFATGGDVYINGFTNVSIRAVMQYVSTVPLYWTATITNGSGSDRTLEFSSVTNRYRFAGTYGTNAPSVLTNGTQILIAGRSDGTNTLVGYTYFAWP